MLNNHYTEIACFSIQKQFISLNAFGFNVFCFTSGV